MEQPTPQPIDPVVFSVGRLDLFVDDEPVGYATGFFYLRDEQLYLVTNRHVLDHGPEHRAPDKLMVRLHTTENVYDNAEFEFPLTHADGRVRWRTWAGADVAVLAVNRARLAAAANITWFTPEHFLPKEYVLEPGEDAFLMGYPYTLRDEPTNLPIFRKAMVASVYGILFEGNPYFLTDGHFHEGMSGGPVIVKPRASWRDIHGRTHASLPGLHYLLGIHSGKLELTLSRSDDGGRSTAEDKELDIALGKAWYPEAINRAIDG